MAAVLPAQPVFGAAQPPQAETAWDVTGLPEIAALLPHIRATLKATAREFAIQGHPVSGNAAGRSYPAVFIRDTATIQPALAFFLPAKFMRESVEAFLRSQTFFASNPATAGAISAVLEPSGRLDKATVVSDEETSLVQAAYAYFKAFGGVEWLAADIAGRTVLDRMGDCLDYLRRTRRWGDTELIYRGHTTDWGDVKREAGPEPTDLASGDDITLSPFDQAWYYRALHDLAGMLDAAGRGEEAEARRTVAAAVREGALANLWQPARGHFLVHKHITDWQDPFDETEIVPISSVLAIYAGLVLPEQVPPIFDAIGRAAAAAGTDRAGLTLHPAYPSDFFKSRAMPAGAYQNGAVWDWWGGLQIVSEFEHGQAERAIGHLRAVAHAWDAAEGVYEWFHIPSQSSQGSADFSGAAGTVAQAVIRGLFGVRLDTDGFTIVPRLGGRSGSIDAVHPEGGALHLAQEAFESFIFLEYETSMELTGAVAVRLPAGWNETIAFFDGRRIDTRHWSVGADRYTGGWQVPGGAHTLIVARLA